MMSKHEIVKLACVLIGVGYFISGLIPAIGAVVEYGAGLDPSQGEGIFWFFSENIANLVAGLILMLFAGAISRLVFSSNDVKPVTSRFDCAEVALSALGFYVFTSVIGSATTLIRMIATSIAYNVSLDAVRFLPELLTALLYIIVGLWLIRSAKSVSVKITGEPKAA